MPRCGFFAIVFTLWTYAASAQAPALNLVYPPVAQPGVEAELRLLGQNFGPGCTLYLPFAAQAKLTHAGGETAVFTFKPAADTAPGVYPIRVRSPLGISNLRLLLVSPAAIVREKEPNNRWTEANPVKLPALLVGELSHPSTDVETFRFAAQAKQRLTFASATRRLGLSPDLLLRLRDAKGRELAYVNNTPGMRGDELLDYTIQQDGDYILEVHNASFNNTAWTNLFCVHAGEWNYAQAVFPLGGKRGAKTQFTVYDRDAKPRTYDVRLPDDPWLDEWRLPLDDYPAALSWPIALGDGPQWLEDDLRAEAADGHSARLPGPGTAHGRIAKSGEEDHYFLAVKPGQRWRVRAQAYFLGSPLDGHLMVLDPTAKKVLAHNHDEEYRGNIDPGLEFTVPEGVEQVAVVIQDTFRRGGLAFAYRLTVEHGGPDFYLALGVEGFRPLNTRERLMDHADTLSLPIGKPVTLPITARRSKKQAPHFSGPVQGYDGPIRLTAHGVPKGVVVTESMIPAHADRGELTVTAGPDAPPEPFEIVILGEGRREDGTLLVRQAERRHYLCEPASVHLPYNWRTRKVLCVTVGAVARDQ
jgi:hypothetical protein